MARYAGAPDHSRNCRRASSRARLRAPEPRNRVRLRAPRSRDSAPPSFGARTIWCRCPIARAAGAPAPAGRRDTAAVRAAKARCPRLPRRSSAVANAGTLSAPPARSSSESARSSSPSSSQSTCRNGTSSITSSAAATLTESSRPGAKSTSAARKARHRRLLLNETVEDDAHPFETSRPVGLHTLGDDVLAVVGIRRPGLHDPGSVRTPRRLLRAGPPCPAGSDRVENHPRWRARLPDRAGTAAWPRSET